ncbi:unnamed protein product [Rotaria socialis]|uniref:Uncharacterized protein n=1 Tax=Rotaria socialis TaxID=392032 RepID=A0A821VXX4_9BILA|nr:unnamed protein product [Rotaria socialis]CAF4916188.1 unnamed protein product [Rotaria socialis]
MEASKRAYSPIHSTSTTSKKQRGKLRHSLVTDKLYEPSSFAIDLSTGSDTCCIDSSYHRLESVTLEDVAPALVLPVLSELQKLPSICRLSLEIDNILIEPPDMSLVYQTLLNFKSLKYLKISMTDTFSDDSPYIYIQSTLNQEPINLEYLVIKHLIYINEILPIIKHTPKLYHLCLRSLNRPNEPLEKMRSKIPKLTSLTRLIIQDSAMTVNDLETLLDAFDCQLQTLKIKTRSYSSFLIDEQWGKLMNTKLSNLRVFNIRLCESESEESNIFDEDDAENEAFIQSSINFVCDSFWYDHGWTARIRISMFSIQSEFRRTKLYDAADNPQTDHKLRRMIHFDNEHHYLNRNLLSSSYSMILDDNLQSIWKNYFSNCTANVSYLPIKQLTIDCQNLLILDLIMILKRLPHVTFLTINSESISEFEDGNNESTNVEDRFDNIEQLEINTRIHWERFTRLMNFFPNLINLYVYCCCNDEIVDAIRGSFSLDDLAGAEYIRRVELIKMKEEEEQNDRNSFLASIESKCELLLSTIRKS